MKKILTMLVLLNGPAALAQQTAAPHIPATGRRLTDFIPAGYEVLNDGQATGDLNRDGRPDAALVLRSKAEYKETAETAEAPPRYLVVLFGTPTGFALAAQASRVMLRQDDGGAFGDPFAGIDIAKGVLSISHYGGSSWRWSHTDKFRYQAGSFYLIGETRVSYQNNTDCAQGNWEMHDTNFVTGEYRVEKESEACKPLVNKRGKNPPKPLRKLVDYAVEP
ncbi:hypothetical protein [Hymenobacter rubidus]|uniref:hypothetical protein n=1 Tax=Hymenobacter rubidus TaxID=1441626 RepID=UPI00191EB7FE|nr:hypothetical protein [Hymenobacter rubidus]